MYTKRAVLALGLVLATSIAFATIPQSEREALIALYNATDGDNWTNNSNWLGGVGTECSWFAVICNVEKTRVLELQLAANQLSGSIPSETADLGALLQLRMPYNELEGSIPNQLGGLSNLQTLKLDGNQLSGAIPTELTYLDSLLSLELGSNQLSGTIPTALGSLTELWELSLHTNQLSGTIPSELGRLSDLWELSLHTNQLSGSIPSELGGLSGLWYLDLHANQLSGTIPPGFGGLHILEELSLFDNELIGSIPGALGSMSNLRNLWLSENQLTGTIPNELGTLSNLEGLRLSDNQLTGSIPSDFGGLKNLGQISLHWNQLEGAIPTELGNLNSLSSLGLSSNQLTGSIPSELGGLTALQYLALGWNHLGGSIPTELGGLRQLHTLYLNINELSGSIPSELSKLSSLIHIALDFNELSGTIPTELGGLGAVRHLWISANHLSGVIPSELHVLDRLESLFLSENQLSGEIPSELGGMGSLQVLGIKENQLSGSIPTELGGLVSLTNAYLSANALTGTIPTELGNISGLQGIGLYSNQLSGTVPEGLPVNYWTLRWNAIRSGALPDDDSQTIPPTGLAATSQGPGSVLVSWDLIAFNNGEGGYRVSYSESPGGPFMLFGETRDKTVSWMTVDGLNPGQTYYFQVVTVTYAHANNQGTVVSQPSATVSGTTAPAGESGSLQLSLPTYVASEGEPKAITVRRLGGATGAVSVRYATSPGSAAEGSDYASTSEWLSWADGDAEAKAFTVPIFDDSIQEGEETFTVTLSEPTGGAVLGNPTTATVTIDDNDYTADDEGDTNSTGYDPVVASDSEGRRVVVWAEDGRDGDGLGIFAQRYDVDGNTVGPQIQVNKNTGGDQHSPAVAKADSGRFIVIFVSESSTKSAKTMQGVEGIFARAFDVDGIPAGDDIPIDVEAPGGYSDPDVVFLPAEDTFAVVWSSGGAKSAKSKRLQVEAIFARAFDLSGTPVGPQVEVDAGDVANPDAAALAGGDVVVVWERYDSDGWSDVFARTLDIGAKTLAPIVEVNTDTWRDQAEPAVSGNADGGFAVAWQGTSLPDEQGEREPGADIFARSFSAGGNPLEDPARVNAGEEYSQIEPAVGLGRDGDCWVSWLSDSASGVFAAFGARLPGCGTPKSLAVDETRLSEDGASVRAADITISPDGDLTAVYSRDDVNEGDGGVFGRAFPYQFVPGECIANSTTLCLNNERFRVDVSWSGFQGDSGLGQAKPLTNDTGYFWFFDSANVELVVKVLDGTGINGHYWVYYGSLSNVQYTLTVTDMQTGSTATYTNPLGSYGSDGDIEALPGGMAKGSPWHRSMVAPSNGFSFGDAELYLRLASEGATQGAATKTMETCTPSADNLCLNQNRFRVTVVWDDFDGNTGTGNAVGLTGDTGYFWFFGPDNVELIVKVLDGTWLNDHFWVYYGALTNVGYTISITDTATGATKQYVNPLGEYGSLGDTEAFAYTPVPTPPTEAPNLDASTVSNAEIELTWTAVNDASGYRLLRGSAVIYGGSATSFSDSGLAGNTQYCYTVLAYNSDGDGPSSATACATTEVGICVPELLSPYQGQEMDNGCSDGRDPKEWWFDWSDCNVVQRYHLYVICSSCEFPVVDDNSIGQSEYEYFRYGFVPDSVRVGWRWRVRALFDGAWGPWTEEQTFDVEPVDTDCP